VPWSEHISARSARDWKRPSKIIDEVHGTRAEAVAVALRTGLVPDQQARYSWALPPRVADEGTFC
jgi:hypothetical protein